MFKVVVKMFLMVARVLPVLVGYYGVAKMFLVVAR